MEEKVNHPSHYNSSKMETIDVLLNTLTFEEYKGFLKGNIIKYLCRYEHKNGIEDLEKAKWYIQRLIDDQKKKDGEKSNEDDSPNLRIRESVHK